MEHNLFIIRLMEHLIRQKLFMVIVKQYYIIKPKVKQPIKLKLSIQLVIRFIIILFIILQLQVIDHKSRLLFVIAFSDKYYNKKLLLNNYL